jgi:nicotinate phosphoribosyltransferase
MLPGAKQVVRRFGPDGRILEDWVMRAADVPDGQGLLECVMRDGRRVREAPPVADIAARAAVALATLPDGAVRRLEPQSLTPSIDPRLAALAVG